MKTVYSIELHLQSSWQPEDIDLIMDDLTEAVALIDHYQTTLFVSTPEDADLVELLTTGMRAGSERGEWLQLGDDWQTNRIFTDYGVCTEGGRNLLDLQLAAVVELAPSDDPAMELEAALEQAAEHAIATWKQEDGRQLLAVDRHQVELLAGIARAYRCDFELIRSAEAD